MKKVFTFGLLTLMVFAGFMLTSCESLSSYKREAKEEINSYALPEDYSSANWSMVVNIVNKSVEAIEAASKKTTIDSIVENTKSDIDCVFTEDMELNPELENIIKTDFLQQFGYEFRYDRFYGIYNGAAVFFIETDDYSIKEVVIAGETFVASSQWKILVWKNGDFYNLEDIDIIFEDGVLTHENLSKIVKIHSRS